MLTPDEERADCTSMPPCRNCEHEAHSGQCDYVYDSYGAQCDCMTYEPMTKADLEEEYGPVND